MNRNKITASEWATAIAEHFAPKIPKGFRTAREISQEIGKSYSRTCEILRVMVAAGKAERVMVRNRPIYKLKV